MKRIWRGILTILMTVIICFPGAALAAEDTGQNSGSGNKYNVVFVIDESGSMLETDENQLRYDATDLFLGLMSREGNYVGAVSFDDKILNAQDIIAVNATEDKGVISDGIRQHSATNGDTDIGNALKTAVDMLNTKGNPALPSAIVLLTDGNTDLDNDPAEISDEEETSIEKKSQAIADARSSGIPVYSVCLNENGEADFSETKQISDATGGEAREVTDAADLNGVYEMFYQMIYGTGGGCVYTGTVPVTATYTVPEIGVEEANILITGDVTDIRFTDPSGNEYTGAETTVVKNATLKKIVNPAKGEWTVTVDGNPEAQIRINLLYNYNFLIRDNTQLGEEAYSKGDVISFNAQLTDAESNVLDLTDQSGYSAEVRFVDEGGNDLDSLPMNIENGCFILDYEIPEIDHAYRYYIAVRLQSDEEGGSVYKKTEIRQFVSGNNTAPVSNGDVEATVKLWPFKHNEYTLDLTTLATDAEDSGLQYSVVSTSFMDKAENPEGDYIIENNTLIQDNFSLRKGEYVIRCIDSGGLYCDVSVTVNSIPIGMMTVVGMIIAAAIIIAVILFGLYTALKTPFYGDIYVKQSYEGEEIKRTKARGRMKLNVFNIPIRGVDGGKSYFQAMKGEGVTLVTNREVTVNGRKGKEHVIHAGGTGTEVHLGDGEDSVIYVRFVSRLSGGVRRRNRTGRSSRRENTRRITSSHSTAGRSAGTSRRGRNTGRSTRRTGR